MRTLEVTRRTTRRLLCALTFATLLSAARATEAQKIPERLTDAEFWSLVSDLSEPDGYFRSDNFVSNETSFQWVIPELRRSIAPGGVYMGVGPDQNYTYIAALKPQIAFIVDIRRQNMMLHLMYKAIFEMSPNRLTFAATLFSRPRPAGIPDSASANDILDAVWRAPREMRLYETNLAAIKDLLVKKHGFGLSPADLRSIDYVYAMFYNIGPGITYQGSQGTPTYWDLMVQTDAAGTYWSYLASEANYHALKSLHDSNRIVPLVGDFAGPRAIRGVAAYLKERNATVSAFYLSNVEQYLFQSDAWLHFYPNAAQLPLDSTSTFIRSLFNAQGRLSATSGRPLSLLGSMQGQLKAFAEGRITSYGQIIDSSR